MALVWAAENSLDLQYYLYHDDTSGGLLTVELWRAAERGVRIRLLVDDMDMSGRDKPLATLNAHPNIQIRIFNPFIRGKARAGQYLSRFGSVTRRMHNKALIADNQLAIIGGRNIGDEYFDANPNLAFGDLDVALTPPAAHEVSEQFDLYWNSELSYPVENLIKRKANKEDLAATENKIRKFYQQHLTTEYMQRLNNSDLVERVREGRNHYFWAVTEMLYDQPEKISSGRDQTEFHLAPKLAPHLHAVTDELIVISPYFVPGKEGVAFFEALEKRGVHVRILTNSLSSNDVPIVHSGYSKYRKQLLKAGIELYEIDKNALGSEFETNRDNARREGIAGSKASLHAKFFILDRQETFIGSLNLDPRSFLENTEIGAIIDSPQLAQMLADNFDSV